MRIRAVAPILGTVFAHPATERPLGQVAAERVVPIPPGTTRSLCVRRYASTFGSAVSASRTRSAGYS